MTKFFVAASALTVGIMFAGWASAQTLDNPPRPGCHAYEAECTTRPLRSGKLGETVRVCAKVKLVCSGERTGVTTVQHVR